jgi:hypothetical protein
MSGASKFLGQKGRADLQSGEKGAREIVVDRNLLFVRGIPLLYEVHVKVHKIAAEWPGFTRTPALRER